MDEIPYAGINQIRFRVGGGSCHPLSLGPQAPRVQMRDPRHSISYASVSPLGRLVKWDGDAIWSAILLWNTPDFRPDGILAAHARILIYWPALLELPDESRRLLLGT